MYARVLDRRWLAGNLKTSRSIRNLATDSCVPKFFTKQDLNSPKALVFMHLRFE